MISDSKSGSTNQGQEKTEENPEDIDVQTKLLANAQGLKQTLENQNENNVSKISVFKRIKERVKKIKNHPKFKHGMILRKFFMTHVILVAADIATDFETSAEFFNSGRSDWGAFTLVPVFAPFIASIIMFSYTLFTSSIKMTGCCKWEINQAKLAVKLKETPSLIWNFPTFYPLKNLRLFFSLFCLDTGKAQNYHLLASIQREAMGSNLYEALLESAPQFILQCAIISTTGTVYKTQLRSIPLSFVSLAMSSVKLYYSQRLGKFPETSPSEKMISFVLPFILLLVAGPLFTLILVTSYFQGMALLFILLSFFLNFVVLNLPFLKKYLFPPLMSLYKKSKHEANIPLQFEEKANVDSQTMLFIAVFTSWISPSTVWANNLLCKSYMLITTCLTSSVIHLSGVTAIFIYLATANVNVADLPAVFHCFDPQGLINSSSIGDVQNDGFSNFSIHVCETGGQCNVSRRICGESESTLDAFYHVVGPLAYLLILTSCMASLILHKLGNYQTMYNWSRKMLPCLKPILTPQYLQDLIRNSDEDEDSLLDTLDNLRHVKKSMLDFQEPLYGETAMHAALDNNMLQILEKFLALDGNVDICNIFSKSTLFLVKEKMSLDGDPKFRKLLEQQESHKASRQVEDLGRVWKVQPMHWAVDTLNPTWASVVSFLGGPWGSFDDDNQGADDKMLLYIDEEKIKLDECNKFTIWWILRASDQYGQNWAHAAVIKEKNTALRRFISLGLDVNFRGAVDGKTPLHYAAIFDRQEAAAILLDSNASVDMTDTGKRTPTHYASARGSEGSVKLFLQAKADVDSKDSNGQTPLHFGVQSGHLGVVRILLDAGADATIQDHDGNTPLHKAAQKAKFECLNALFEHNHDVCKMQNSKGQCPSQLLSATSEQGIKYLQILMDAEKV